MRDKNNFPNNLISTKLKKHAHGPGQHGKNYHDADNRPDYSLERFFFHNIIVIERSIRDEAISLMTHLN